MKKQDRIAALDESRIADLQQRVDQLTSELDRPDAGRADAGTLLDELTNALVGELDPDRDRRQGRALGHRVIAPAVFGRAPAGRGQLLRTSRPCPFASRSSTATRRWDGSVSAGPSSTRRSGRCSTTQPPAPAARSARPRSSSGRSHVFRTLERSLLPDALLPLPGTAARQPLPRRPRVRTTSAATSTTPSAVDDRITLIVGDVQGKGVEAATLTSLARHTLRAGALADREPAALLEQLNTALLYGQAEQLHAGKDPVLRFVTAVVARIEPTDRRVLRARGPRGAAPARDRAQRRHVRARRAQGRASRRVPGPGVRGGTRRSHGRRHA